MFKRKFAAGTITAIALAGLSGVTFASAPDETVPFWGLWPSAITQPPRQQSSGAAKQAQDTKEQKAAVKESKKEVYEKSPAGQAEAERMTGAGHETTKYNP